MLGNEKLKIILFLKHINLKQNRTILRFKLRYGREINNNGNL